jgi:hypothetical protein
MDNKMVISDGIPTVPRKLKFSEFRSEAFRGREKCSILKCCFGAFRGRENSSEYHSLDQMQVNFRNFVPKHFSEEKRSKLFLRIVLPPPQMM